MAQIKGIIVDPLISALRNKDPKTRWRSAELLGRIAGSLEALSVNTTNRALESLKEFYHSETNLKVRKTLRNAIFQFQERLKEERTY